MKAGRAFLFTAALFVSAPLRAAPDASAPVPAPAASTGLIASLAAPSSATSPDAMIAKAFQPKTQTCEANAPGPLPLLEPAARNQPVCVLSPFTHNQWGLCPAFPPSPVLPLPPDSPHSGQQQAFITGRQIDGVQQGISVISGDVQLDQGDHRVTSQHMIYDSGTGLASIREGVNYYTPQLVVTSPTGRYDTNNGEGSFDDALFYIPKRHGHGSSDLVVSLDTQHSRLYTVQYTTCPVGQTDWSLNAPDMYLDMSTNTGEGHDVTIDFLGVPIFWTPYINFPLNDERKSGFLSGAFSFDAVNGIEFEAPYYFNLAPNYDDILYPRIISKRGIQLGNAFELLTPMSYDYLYASYLPHDMLETGPDSTPARGQLLATHQMDLGDSWHMSGVYNWVSDDNFFHDLNSDLAITSSTYLSRDMDLRYRGGPDFSSLTRILDYQVIDPAINPLGYPYRSLPSINVSMGNNDSVSGPEYELNAELVRYQRANRLGAWRFSVKPSVSWPLTASFGFFTPTLAWRYNKYDLGEQQLAFPAGMTVPDPLPLPYASSHPSLSVPIFSINTGLYFDREAGDYLQTLEPQLYYLRVPYRNQSGWPDFDSPGILFNFFQLFNDNDFYGVDRQSDANQLSYALTTRLLDTSSGAELLRADVGQIRYFSPVKVNPSGVPQTNLFSDITADVSVNINEQWTASHEQLWDPVSRQTDLGNVLLQYHPAYHRVVSIGYQFQRGPTGNPSIKQTDFSYSWPLAGNWSMVGRWNYDIVNHVTLQDFVGFEYENCCWDFQILHRHVVIAQNVYDNVFFFQLSLKGLVTAGKHLDDLVENGILGYSDNAFTDSQQTAPP